MVLGIVGVGGTWCNRLPSTVAGWCNGGLVAQLHLLSDFDGVWTEPARELVEVRRAVVAELAGLVGETEALFEEVFETHLGGVFAEPQDHGWRVEGRITSYVDEDHFGVPASVGHSIEAAGDELGARVRAAVARTHGDMTTFLNHCYHSTCTRYRLAVAHDLTAGAASVLRELLAAGVRVTFATNAPAEKVVDWFGAQDLEVTDAAKDPRAPLRVFGRAGKQWLGPEPTHLEFAGRRVFTDRPQYQALLEQERPDAVIGDVLSLDLATPLAMRAAGNPAAPRAILLRRNPATPAWVEAAVGAAPHHLDALLEHVRALPECLLQLAPSGGARA
ncbi:MAG TPA: hypothetical protein VGC54_12490 [Planctomycetota bacterium]